MRIKTIEKLFPLDQCYKSIKSYIESQYEIDENSYISGSNLLLLGIDIKDKTVVIRASIDESMNRTYLSIIVLQTKELQNSIIEKEVKDVVKSIGKALFKIISKGGEAGIGVINPFIGLAIKGLKFAVIKYGLITTEKQLFSEILNILYEKFGYNDVLMEYPFSITELDGNWELWQDSYHPYLTSIENRLMANRDTSIKTYRNYDFALPEDQNQRIFDLIIVEEKEKKFISHNVSTGLIPRKYAEKFIQRKARKAEYGTHFLQITFVYCNRLTQPLSLIQLTNISEEIGNFAKIFQQKNKDKYIAITPRVIFLSLFGYAENIHKYLQNNNYGEIQGVIPIFVLPPINNCWHNYKEVENLNKKEEKELEEVTQIVRMDAQWSGSYKIAKLQYDKLSEKKKKFDMYNEISTEWNRILNINLADELLDIVNNKNKIKNRVIEYNA